MSGLVIAAATFLWLATGYLGWLNGITYLNRRYGENTGEPREILWTIVLGPCNLVTFFMWGNNLRPAVSK